MPNRPSSSLDPRDARVTTPAGHPVATARRFRLLVVLAIFVAAAGLGAWFFDRQDAVAQVEASAAVDRLAVAAADVDTSGAWTLEDGTFADLAQAAEPARLTAEWGGPQEATVFQVVATPLGASACREVTAQPRGSGGFEVSQIEEC